MFQDTLAKVTSSNTEYFFDFTSRLYPLKLVSV